MPTKKPDYVQTIMKKKLNSAETQNVKIPVFLPHKILLYLFNVLGLAIPWEKLQTYWQHLKLHLPGGTKNIEGTPIPLCLYGDTARYGQGFDQSKITGFWLSIPLWRPKSTRMSQWLLWSLNADLSCGEQSHNPLYLAIVRSLNSCINGETPEGGKLPSSFAVTEIRGDWEWFWQTFRLKQWYKTKKICWRCSAENAENATHCYLDVSENPSWLDTMYTHNDFMLRVLPDDLVCCLAPILVLCTWARAL